MPEPGANRNGDSAPLATIQLKPRPFDAVRVDLGFERWAENTQRLSASTGDRDAALAISDTSRDLLAVIFGNSPYLTQLVLRDPAITVRILRDPPEDLLGEFLRDLRAASDHVDNQNDLMRHLRVAKHRIALLAAVTDLSSRWSLEEVTRALSDLADGALDQTIRFLLREAARRGDLALPDQTDPAAGSGVAIFALGKHGARELNYSSDIDIMVLYDQECVDYRGKKDPTSFYARLTKTLVEIMQKRTAEGYVFRTDLRLRPDPGTSPLAISMAAAESYYESLGQNWERAAMIKARAAAGDVVAGQAYLDRLAPFVWRKYLDFAAIEDIHSIKRQIHSHRGHGDVALAGHNIKIGRGGIREIEFFAQTQQLIAGGRDQRLREPTTRGAIRALAATGRLDPHIAKDLVECYRFLRTLEHRLQMVNDEQTQTLPSDDDGLEQLAAFLGFASRDDFGSQLSAVLGEVQTHYAALFEAAPSLGEVGGSLVFTGTDDDPETLETLQNMGFTSPRRVTAAVRKWHHGRYRAARSTRAREKLTALMPMLLQNIGATAQPDVAFARFDEFLSRLPAGIQLFSMFYANPWLLRLLARIMGTAPALAELLSRNAVLLDGVLGADFFQPLPAAPDLSEELAARLQNAVDYQDVLDETRRWAGDKKFQVGLQILETPEQTAAGTKALSDVADATLQCMLPHVEAAFQERHGAVPGGGIAIIAMGKLGSREMTFNSDMDLIFVYDHDPDTTRSDGPKPLSPLQYFSRLSQRMIAALTALTPEGRLYEVDMRLRPSGKSGPIAVALAGFQDYHANTAWAWEHMALTRARVVAGNRNLADAAQEVIRQTLEAPRDQDKLAADILDMRRRVTQELGDADPWNIKHARGGLLDGDFIAQFLQLKHATAHPDILRQDGAVAIRRMGDAGLIDRDIADGLAAAITVLRNVQSLLRLCTAGDFDEGLASADLKQALANAAGETHFDLAKAKVLAAEDLIDQRFDSLVGNI